MKIIFMGTPDFAVPTLDAIIAAGHDVIAVFSQPARAAGRGQMVRKSPVHRAADKHGIAVRTPRTLKSQDEQTEFIGFNADAAVVAAYGLILPPAVLEAPRHGCFNLHASLLPRWRGAAPVQRAIMAGDTETGVCVMQMDAGLDTGPVCLSKRTPVLAGTTAGALHDQLAALGAPLVCEALTQSNSGELTCITQPADGVTYADRIDKSEARIDFDLPAHQVLNHIHGLSPFPGAWFGIESAGRLVRIKLLKAGLVEGAGQPGHVLDDDMTIACATGAIRPVTLQRAGKGEMTRQAFLRGFDIAAGTNLDGT